MNNLFVCHTQAQLILATGLSCKRFYKEDNYLIVFVDFNITEELKSNLLKCFINKVLLLQGTYPPEYKSWKSKIKRYPHDLKLIKEFMKVPFGRIFEVCDGCIPKMYILKYANQLNKKVENCWLEDGSCPYFRNVVKQDGFNSNNFSRFMHKIIFKYMCGLGKFYDKDFNASGGNAEIKYAYLPFPGMEREPYRSSKEIRGISNEEYIAGIKIMYAPMKLDLRPNSILLVLDKLDAYKYPESVKDVIQKILVQAQKDCLNIYVKFHPREDDEWEIFSTCEKLNKNIGIESIYSTLLHQNTPMKIVGMKSTRLQNAKIMGFPTFSLAPICGEVNKDLLDFYQKIGVNIIESSEDLQYIFTK